MYGIQWRFLIKLPNLTALRITRSPTLDNNSFKYLARCTTLLNLDLSGCIWFTNNLYHLTTLRNLTALNLSLCTGITSWDILEYFPHLVTLKLNRTPLDITAKTIYIPSLRRLEVLSLNDNVLTESDINSISTLPHLKVLHLCGCKTLDGNSLNPLSNLKCLTTLTLQTCDGLDHLNFLKFLTNLVHLDIAYCRHLTDKIVVEFVHYTNLQRLRMVGLIQVRDKTKREITNKLKYTVVEY